MVCELKRFYPAIKMQKSNDEVSAQTDNGIDSLEMKYRFAKSHNSYQYRVLTTNMIAKTIVLRKLVDLIPDDTTLEVVYCDCFSVTVTPSPLVYVVVVFLQISNFSVSVFVAVPLQSALA